MRSLLVFCVILILLFAVFPVAARAGSVSSVELIENSKEFDGKKIVYQGEVVGDLMLRGEHAWMNVNDGENALGIWCSADSARKIKHKGSYSFFGDTVVIEGIFHRACSEHGGDMDIHATKIDVTKAGHRVSHPFNKGKALLAFGLLMLSGVLFAINRLKVRKLQG